MTQTHLSRTKSSPDNSATNFDSFQSAAARQQQQRRRRRQGTHDVHGRKHAFNSSFGAEDNGGKQIDAAQCNADDVPFAGTKNDILWRRKLFHACCGLGMVLVSLLVPLYVAKLLLLTALAAVSCIEIGRKVSPAFNVKILRLNASISRAGEANRVAGILSYVASATIVAFCAPIDVARMSVLALAFGDPCASLVGIACRRRNVLESLRMSNGKSLVGTVASFCVSLVASTLYLLACTDATLGVDLLARASITSAAAAFSELFEPLFDRVLPSALADDNFYIPICASFATMLVTN
jgi:dolichol kinase